MDYIRDENGDVLTKNSSSNIYYGSGTSDTYWDYYLNSTWYNSITSNYKNMLVEGTYYLGMTESSYKGSICTTVSNTETTTECIKTSSTWTGYVGLPRYGEMFASQQGSGNLSSSHIWLITPSSSSFLWYIRMRGNGGYLAPSSDTNAVRPSITLNSSVKISSGSGLKNDPFEISL